MRPFPNDNWTDGEIDSLSVNLDRLYAEAKNGRVLTTDEIVRENSTL